MPIKQAKWRLSESPMRIGRIGLFGRRLRIMGSDVKLDENMRSRGHCLNEHNVPLIALVTHTLGK